MTGGRAHSQRTRGPARPLARLVAIVVACALASALAACNGSGNVAGVVTRQAATGDTNQLRVIAREPETLDPMLAPEGDLFALNVFDRLVETHEVDGAPRVEPSLIEHYAISPDGLTYTFRLREGVSFSNGSALTAHDVQYSLERLASHPASPHAHLVANIIGTREYLEGRSSSVAGIRVLDNLDIEIDLERPQPAFLASLSSTGASIVDLETTAEAGEGFGEQVDLTVGTGPFVLASFERGESLAMTANRTCWSGVPPLRGVRVSFITDAMPYQAIYEAGDVDVIDIGDMGMDGEYFVRGDLYRPNLVRDLRADATLLVLGSSEPPLDDLRVRQALVHALDRETLLKAVYGGRGVLVGGIVPRSLLAGEADPPELSYDPDLARELLSEAGLGGGFDLTISHPASAGVRERTLLELVSLMWGEVGVRVSVDELPDAAFAQAHDAGLLACHAVNVLAGYDDPEAIFAPLFLSSSSYEAPDHVYVGDDISRRLLEASGLSDDAERQAAFRRIDEEVVDGCLCIPICSSAQVLVVADGIEGLGLRWNGAAGVDLRGVRIVRAQE